MERGTEGGVAGEGDDSGGIDGGEEALGELSGVAVGVQDEFAGERGGTGDVEIPI